MPKEQKQSFVKGAAILSASTLIVKLLGLLFSIPLANTVSVKSMSYFYTAYDIFTVFLILSTAGLPIAVSRMVATSYNNGYKKQGNKVLSVSFWLFFSLGLFGALVMFFFADFIAGDVMGNPGAGYAIMALAPTMFFISIMSAYRGYFQGRSNMIPTAMSQMIEATTKILIGIPLALLVVFYMGDEDLASAGAILGVSISAGLGALYLMIYHARQKRIDRLNPDKGSDEVKSAKNIIVELLKFSIPIAVGVCFLNVLDLIDASILMTRIQDSAGFTLDEAEFARGVLGHARKFYDLPGAFVIPFSTSLLPILSAAVEAKRTKEINTTSALSLKLTLLVAIPSSIGMIIFADPISRLLLIGNPSAADGTIPLLASSSIGIIFTGMIFTTNSILQSFGKPNIPVRNMAIGGILKIILSYILIGIPEINVMGAVISSVVSYLLIMILNIVSLRKFIPKWQGFIKTAFRPTLSALCMGGISYGIYMLLSMFISPQFAVIPVIFIAILLYAVFCLLFKAVKYEDVVSMPKGRTIARILKLKPSEE